MAARLVSDQNSGGRRRAPATTPEARENQLVSAAVELAEKQIRDGTASAQVITHYLKLGSTREKLEQARLQHEIKLAEAKIDSMASARRVEELMGEALDAFRAYSGQPAREKPESYDA